MLSTTDQIVSRRQHELRIDRAERYGWLYPSSSPARRRNRPVTTLKLTARWATCALTALAAVAFGRG